MSGGGDPAEDAPRPGNYDRAWNDPPLFSYGASSEAAATAAAAAAGGGGGMKLNKRVAFPPVSQRSSAGTSKPPPQPGRPPEMPPTAKLQDAGAKPLSKEMPPPPPPLASAAATAPPPAPTTTRQPANDATKFAVEEVTTSLTAFIDGKSTLPDSKKKDVKKRLDMMANKWKAGSLNDKVKSGMGQVSGMLERDEASAAEKLFLSLMVDWPALCSPWGVGIKHLLVNAKEIESAAGMTDGGGDGARPQAIDKPL